MLLPLHLNLEDGAAPAPTPEPTVDKGRDAGSGRPQWWEGEWITPGVDAYLPEKPPEDITPLRPKVEKARKRLAEVRDIPDYKALSGRLTGLSRSVARLEKQAEDAVKAREIEAAILKVTARHRELSARMAAIETEIALHEARMAHKKRLLAEDEEFLQLLAKIL